ncbi:amino acid ABC transporter permease [Saccharospirillum mangrovi]|uniref:amino acid ABC transporter permease n=1 Tax=Saccharospirillum mangrovi TaxID=2161747 RepID=UPI000D385690|nr:amino acid ABC transporter permease [Saccharospirillum mangrovi]
MKLSSISAALPVEAGSISAAFRACGMIALSWCRHRLFRTPLDTVITLLVAGFLLRWVPAVVGWFSWNAVGFWSDAELCRTASGACWPFIREKARLILFGTYPFDEQWRPALACVLLIGLVAASMIRALYSRALVVAWTLGSLAFFMLMQGGELGLAPVASIQWNGLPVLLMLSVFSVLGAFPLGVLLALARFQKDYPVISSVAVAYIEIVRGIPMVMVLFMGLFILPLMLPQGFSLDPLFTTLIVLIFFHAAYFAEEVRSGLQAVPNGQREAAASQGFSYWQSMRLIVLPQALKRAMPGNMNALLGAYKDTSLVVILGIHDIMTTAKMAYSEPQWQHYGVEAYCLVALWYFSTCLCLSTYSRRLERTQKNS